MLRVVSALTQVESKFRSNQPLIKQHNECFSSSRTQSGQPKPNCEREHSRYCLEHTFCLEIGSARPMRTNECIGGADRGPCTGQIKRWYYVSMVTAFAVFKHL